MSYVYHPNAHKDAILMGEQLGGSWAGLIQTGKIIRGEAKSVGTPAEDYGLVVIAFVLWAGMLAWLWFDDGPAR